MYRYYKKEQEEKNLPFAKRCTYETIFNTEFNISFYQPKKDQCSICEEYKNSNPDEKAKLQESYDRHIANKIKSREEKAKDTAMAKDKLNLIVACFDLQAVLPTPCGDVSAFYYKCRLNSIASRGSNEIATCLYSYISSLPPNTDIIFCSDNCVGQNKNKIVVSMYLYAMCNTEVNSIVHKFLTVGHTQNEGDSMHSVIERQKKRALKSEPIFVPSQWPPLMKTAIKEGRP
ncbi:hypothetical protein RI129_002924 [Pyrocoelia pectoralis]|uniref:DUF7869 domain-containing protein n=1 Tax=Pyrocoelia pectoralis TaxID=417401 RepID=A0AAN7ZM31_9COLE